MATLGGQSGEPARSVPWFQEGDTKHAPKYNSQELDQETGYYFYNARHYDGEIARFVTPDTVIDGEDSVAGWNRYMYVHGNPIVYKDPTGHSLGSAGGGLLRRIINYFSGDSNKNNSNSSGENSKPRANVSSNSIKKNTDKIKQVSTLAKYLDNFVSELENSKEHNPYKSSLNTKTIAETSCFSASSYNWLKMMGANVESSYEDFFKRWTKKVPSWNPSKDQNKRVIDVRNGQVNAMDEMINSYKVGEQKLNHRTTGNYKDFKKSTANVGVVIVNTKKGMHMFNVYRDKKSGEWLSSDVGGGTKHGSKADDTINHWGKFKEFRYAEFQK